MDPFSTVIVDFRPILEYQIHEKYSKFREHVPDKPKTELSLHTFFVPIPLVCYENELRVNAGKQEIKVEFITYPCNMVRRRSS